MILCAAISVRFLRSEKYVDAVIPGHRHSNCWELMSTFGIPADREELRVF